MQSTDTTGTPAAVKDPWAHQEGFDSHEDSDIHEVSFSYQGLWHLCHVPPTVTTGLGCLLYKSRQPVLPGHSPEESVEILQAEEHLPHSSAGTKASILLCRSRPWEMAER